MEDNNDKLNDEENKSMFSDISSYSKGSNKNSDILNSPKSDEGKNEEDKTKFIMKNGCCRDCMRAFSKTGKSCLCQVPKMERNYTLPEKGCHFCECHGKLISQMLILILN